MLIKNKINENTQEDILNFHPSEGPHSASPLSSLFEPENLLIFLSKAEGKPKKTSHPSKRNNKATPLRTKITRFKYFLSTKSETNVAITVNPVIITPIIVNAKVAVMN